jgi:hypothetical protein
MSTRTPVPERPDRVLVLNTDLSTAAAVALALAARGCTARIALPVTLEHLEDVVAWRPEIALVNADDLGEPSSDELVAFLDEREIPVVLVTAQGDNHPPLQRAQIVVEKGSETFDFLPTLTRLLGLSTEAGGSSSD